MTCPEAKRQLSAVHSGEPAFPHCDECRRLVQEERQFVALIERGLRGIRPLRPIAPAIREHLAAAEVPVPARRAPFRRIRRTRPPRPAWQIPGMVAAGMLLAALVLLSLAPNRPTLPALPTAIRPEPEPPSPAPRPSPPRAVPVPEPRTPGDRPPTPLDRVPRRVRPAAATPKETAPRPAPPGRPEPPKAVPRPTKTEALVARLERVEGDVRVVTGAGRIAAKAGEVLPADRGVETIGSSSRVTLVFADASRVTLGGDGEIRELRDRDGKRLLLVRGSVRADIRRQPRERAMVLSTPHGTATVLGTSFELDVTPAFTWLEVRSGRVRLTRGSDGESVDVSGGYFAVAGAGRRLESRLASRARVREDLVALYEFLEGRGTVVRGSPESSAAPDLRIRDAGNARFIAEGGLSIQETTIVAADGPASGLVAACKRSNELTIESWIRTADPTQNGPARLVSLAPNTVSRNFTLAMNGVSADPPRRNFSIRLRTTRTSRNGTAAPGDFQPLLFTPPGTASARLTHVAFTRDASGRAVFYVNGARCAERSIPGDFSTWDDGYRLALANELNPGGTPVHWRGAFYLVALYSRALTAKEVAQNHRVGPRARR